MCAQISAPCTAFLPRAKGRADEGSSIGFVLIAQTYSGWQHSSPAHHLLRPVRWSRSSCVEKVRAVDRSRLLQTGSSTVDRDRPTFAVASGEADTHVGAASAFALTSPPPLGGSRRPSALHDSMSWPGSTNGPLPKRHSMPQSFTGLRWQMMIHR